MSRIIPAGILNALNDPEIEPFYAVELQFDSGTMRMWTGYGSKTIGGNTYSGTGNLLQIEGLEEANDLSSKGATLSLSGLDNSIISYALSEKYQGRLVKIFWGVQGVSDVVEIFSGFMDKMTINDAAESATISLSVESRLITLERPNVRRYTVQSHKGVLASKGLSSTDTFFNWVTKLQDKQIVWGREVGKSDEVES